MVNNLYLLQDGTHAASGDVKRGKDGVLRHKNGMAVCLYENGEPQTVGEDAERNKNVQAANAGKDADEHARSQPEHDHSDRRVAPHQPHEHKAG